MGVHYYRATCLEDYEVALPDGLTFTLRRGDEHTISLAREAGRVTVYASCWLDGVPRSVFGELREKKGGK